MQMKKQKMTAYQNQNGVDFVEVLPYQILTDLVSMYICTMHPNYRLLLSECKKTDEGQICVFVKKNALPIKCVVSKQGDNQDFVADKNFQKIYHFCCEWDVLCPDADKKSFVEKLNEKNFCTNNVAICRADLFGFAKQNYGNGLLPYIDQNFYF